MERKGTAIPKPPVHGLPAFDRSGITRFNIRKILVPVDFSSSSKKALHYASRVALEFCAKVDVLYVLPPYHLYDPFCVTNRMQRELKVNGQQKLAALALQEIPNGLPVETLVRSGQPANEIVETAKRMDTDIIIISSHGQTGIESTLGGTTEYVVRHAPCPVLVVREKELELLT